MSRRKDPVDVVVAFFETAPIETAQTVLAVARGILARRTPKAKPATRKNAPLTAKDRRIVNQLIEETTNLLDGAETVPPHVKTTRGGLAVPEDE